MMGWKQEQEEEELCRTERGGLRTTHLPLPAWVRSAAEPHVHARIRDLDQFRQRNILDWTDFFVRTGFWK